MWSATRLEISTAASTAASATPWLKARSRRPVKPSAPFQSSARCSSTTSAAGTPAAAVYVRRLAAVTPTMVARMQVRLIVNPNASGVRGALIDQVAARLARAGEVEVRLTERPGQATDLARAPGADVVVAMGGDGTANEVANGMPPEVLMGVVPAGASSVFARQLRLPRQTLPAAAVLAGAIAERRWRPVGLGSVNGRMFTFSAGMGLEAEATRIVDERRRQRADGRRPRDSAVVAAAGRALWSDRLSMPERITVTAGARSAARVLPRDRKPASLLVLGPAAGAHDASCQLCVGAGRGGRVGSAAAPAVAAAGLRPGVAASRAGRRSPGRVPARRALRSTSPATSRSGCSWTASTSAGVQAAAVRYHPQALQGAHPTRGGGILPGPGPGAGSGRYVTLGRPRVGWGTAPSARRRAPAGRARRPAPARAPGATVIGKSWVK